MSEHHVLCDEGRKRVDGILRGAERRGREATREESAHLSSRAVGFFLTRAELVGETEAVVTSGGTRLRRVDEAGAAHARGVAAGVGTARVKREAGWHGVERRHQEEKEDKDHGGAWSAEGGLDGGSWEEVRQGCPEMQIGRRAGDMANAALWLLLGNGDWMWRRGRATESRNAEGDGHEILDGIWFHFPALLPL